MLPFEASCLTVAQRADTHAWELWSQCTNRMALFTLHCLAYPLSCGLGHTQKRLIISDFYDNLRIAKAAIKPGPWGNLDSQSSLLGFLIKIETFNIINDAPKHPPALHISLPFLPSQKILLFPLLGPFLPPSLSIFLSPSSSCPATILGDTSVQGNDLLNS